METLTNMQSLIIVIGILQYFNFLSIFIISVAWTAQNNIPRPWGKTTNLRMLQFNMTNFNLCFNLN